MINEFNEAYKVNDLKKTSETNPNLSLFNLVIFLNSLFEQYSNKFK